MSIARWLRVPHDRDHKYSRGVLGVRTGSTRYPGAAVLSVEAAWRTGIGMVRFASPAESVANLVLSRRPETVLEEGPVDAWLIGSGMVLDPTTTHKREAIARALGGDEPVVLDAGAMSVLTVDDPPHAPTIITPHTGEFRDLASAAGLGDLSLDSIADRTRATQHLARALGVTVLLKSSVTIIADPNGDTAETEAATPWLATAGTGDVLGGILGALIASNADEAPEHLVAIAHAAATLHDAAARLIAFGDAFAHDAPARGIPLTALDVAEAVSLAVEQLRR